MTPHSHNHSHAPHSHSHSHSHSASDSHSHSHGQAGPVNGQAPHSHAAPPSVTAKRPLVFSKIFRWKQEQPGPLPVKVEITGSFNGWEKTPLKYDRTNAIWQLTLENIPGNCTHSYMLLVNGRPTSDKNSDGLAVPKTEPEQQYQLETPRGPRVFMLFSQTK